MYSALSPGAIGVSTPDLETAIAAAKTGGFQGVEVSAEEVATRVQRHGAAAINSLIHAAGLRAAGWGLPVPWRGASEEFEIGLAKLPEMASACAAIGCTRTFTWIMPMSNDLDYDENRRFHVDRLTRVAQVLGRHGCRFGLEFIGPKTLRDQGKYPFIYEMGQMLEMTEEIGPNVGLLLDCWHWYTSHGELEQLAELNNEQIVYVHVNDAPLGIGIDEQMDGTRALPGETGVIPIGEFLSALASVGYDGPVVPEPFKAELKELPSDEARLKAVGASMVKIWDWA